ncbi:MAG TPA: class I SAM-dependent methyltransferase [Bryobacteraceae bacterium]|jgi:SAM-dependent methyltransferase|nr:class I SAM-dependent methyltransferase [Bryobacteraceae bacterium]
MRGSPAPELAGMGECGLYDEPALYDLLFPEAWAASSLTDEVRRARILGSERFYLERATAAKGRVLELACGTGRLTIPIAQRGIEVVGADLSESMLSAARNKAAARDAPATFVQADMRNFELPGPFSAILIPGNSLLHLLTNEDLRQCLACVRRHLAPGGRFVFDISKWDLALLAADPAERHLAYLVEDPEHGEIRVEESAGYDAQHQVRHVNLYVSSGSTSAERLIRYSLRVIFPQELLLLLELTGFQLEARYGEFPCQPFDASSPRQVCICSAR